MASDGFSHLHLMYGNCPLAELSVQIYVIVTSNIEVMFTEHSNKRVYQVRMMTMHSRHLYTMMI